MSKVADTINQIMKNEDITLSEVYERYPHLKEMQVQEFNKEISKIEEASKDDRKLLHD